jgi:phosphoribosylanthranilate isomerase
VPKRSHSDLRIKICGLTHREDAWHAVRAGADFIGAILSDGFVRSVPPERARAFREAGGPPLVGVLVNPTVEDARARAQASGASILQLHGEESPELLTELRQAGAWTLWKAVRPRSVDELHAAVARFAHHVDALLLDGWHPEKRGGSGTRFDWAMVARVRAELPDDVELIVAGGLTPATVGDAVAALAPDVVDVSSGVEAEPGRKDPIKVEAFIRAARLVRHSVEGPNSEAVR